MKKDGGEGDVASRLSENTTQITGGKIQSLANAHVPLGRDGSAFTSIFGKGGHLLPPIHLPARKAVLITQLLPPSPHFVLFPRRLSQGGSRLDRKVCRF